MWTKSDDRQNKPSSSESVEPIILQTVNNNQFHPLSPSQDTDSKEEILENINTINKS